MFRSRISRRVLAQQHIALTSQYHDAHDHGPVQDSSRFIGIIDTELSPQAAIASLSPLLPLVTGMNAEVTIDGSKDVTFTFVEEHLRFIVFEMLKNSVLGARDAGKRAKITCTIADSPKTIGVRISDECQSAKAFSCI